MSLLIKAIQKINPKAKVSINADDINQITWHNGYYTYSCTNEILAKQTRTTLQNIMQSNIKEIEQMNIHLS
jgi:hypothetical protein